MERILRHKLVDTRSALQDGAFFPQMLFWRYIRTVCSKVSGKLGRDIREPLCWRIAACLTRRGASILFEQRKPVDRGIYTVTIACAIPSCTRGLLVHDRETSLFKGRNQRNVFLSLCASMSGHQPYLFEMPAGCRNSVRTKMTCVYRKRA